MGMFDWFRSKPECPVDDASRSWVDARWRWLEGQFGVERVRKCAAVLPRPEFFPDSYDGTEDDARRVLDRVCGYMDVDPGCIEMSLYSDQGPLAGHPMFEGQWQGTTGLYHPEGDKFRVWLEAANLHDPLAMVATMAHELGHVHLLGHGRLSGDEEDQEPLTDLLTVYFGLGAITANSVIREQSWQEGPFSGWKMGRQGYLTMPIYGYALARFAHSRGEDGTEWARELRPDVRAPFKQAMRFLSAEQLAARRGRAEPDATPGSGA